MYFYQHRLSLLILFAVLQSCVCTTGASAQMLISKLPKDGTWARYSIKKERELEPGGTYQKDAEMAIRVVGTKHINMEAFRWIEIEKTESNQDGSYLSVCKFLIKESDVRLGQNPMTNLTKFFLIKIKDKQSTQKEYDVKDKSIRYLETYFPYELEGTKKLETKKIVTGSCTFDCVGHSGYFVRKASSLKEFRSTYTTFTTDKSPFGAALFIRADEFIYDGQIDHKNIETISLQSTGTGAVSISPELR